MRKIQIGVIGSMMDKKDISKTVLKIAEDLGRQIARSKAILLFGFENDFNSISQIAAKSAEKNNGETMAFIYENRKISLGDLRSKIVTTGQSRGGGREFPFILSSDAIIAMGGGSGTLTEIAIAYQAGIPVIAIANTGGWSEKLAGSFLDSRKRQKIHSVKTVQEAVGLVFKLLASGQ